MNATAGLLAFFALLAGTLAESAHTPSLAGKFERSSLQTTLGPSEERALLKPASGDFENYTVPDWFRNAKFGIFMHFGIHSATEFDAWYARRMYEEVPLEPNLEPWCNPTGNESISCVYDYHLATYGHPSVFGFKDFIPKWTAEHWDPDALVAFYTSIGAKYIVPVALYHDNFDNFNSSHHRWNSVNMGPRQDIVGGWKKACDKYGLRLGVSDHASRSWQWLAPVHSSDSSGHLAAVPYDGAQTLADGKGKWWEGFDPQEMYLAPRPVTTTVEETPESFKENWFNRVSELLEVYEPDLLYFDWGDLPNDKYGVMLAQQHFEASAKRHGGESQAIINVKLKEGEHRAPAFVRDVEKGRLADLKPYVWQTDTTLNDDWFYVKDRPLRITGPQVIQYLVDVVSKNGNLLLNVGLMPNGTLPADQRHALTQVGDWLSSNGEAIYDTRPWVKFGEGPTKGNLTGGSFSDQLSHYTNLDIRFTSKGDILYATVLSRPDVSTLITSLPIDIGPIVHSVKILGKPELLKFYRDTAGLTVFWPNPLTGEHAWVLEIATTPRTSTPKD